MTRVALTLSKSTVTFPGNTTLYNIPDSAAKAITQGWFVDFPAPWLSVSGDPGIELSITNNSVSAPVAPILCDKWVSSVDSQTYYYPVVEFSTVQPGQSSPISGGGVVGEVAAVMPTTTMRLALMYLGAETTDTTSGWTYNVAAWAV